MKEGLETLRELVKRWAVKANLKAWWRKISSRDSLTWETVSKPNAAARAAGLPKVKEFRGLLAVIEIVVPELEWRFQWASKEAAALQHDECVKRFGAMSTDGRAIRRLSVAGKSRREWGTVLVVLGALAAISGNVEKVQDLVDVIRHRPKVQVRQIEERFAANKAKEITLELTGVAAQRLRFKNGRVSIRQTHDACGKETKTKEDVKEIDKFDGIIPPNGTLTHRVTIPPQEAGMYLLEYGGLAAGLFRNEEVESQKIGTLVVREAVRTCPERVTIEEKTEPGSAAAQVAAVQITIHFGQVGQRNIALYFQLPYKCVSALLVFPNNREIAIDDIGKCAPDNVSPPSFNLTNVPAKDFSDIELTLFAGVSTAVEKTQWESELSQIKCHEIPPPLPSPPPSVWRIIREHLRNP